MLIVWVLILLASLPFAMRQTENLTSGGFTVPGSGSDAVDRGLTASTGREPAARRAWWRAEEGASDAEVQRGHPADQSARPKRSTTWR